eukprot:184136-Pyramimonas_sp.AAC.1
MKLCYAAEIEQDRRDVIQAHAYPEQLFKDVVGLESSGWRGEEVMSGQTVAIKPSRFFVAGFECDSVSGLFHGRSEMQSRVQEGKGSTGRTARATMQWIIESRPWLSVLECVKTLGAKNLAFMTKEFNREGFHFEYFCRDAAKFGSPERQERKIMLVYPVSNRPIDQTDPEYQAPPWMSKLFDYLNRIQVAPLSVEEVLLPDDHPHLLAALQELRAKKHSKETASEAQKVKKRKVTKCAEAQIGDAESEKKEKKSETDWRSVHLDMYRKVGLTWPPARDASDLAVKEFLDWTAHLTERLRQVAWFYHMCVKQDCSHLLSMHDLTVNLDWHSAQYDRSPTVTCTSVMYIIRNKANWR